MLLEIIIFRNLQQKMESEVEEHCTRHLFFSLISKGLCLFDHAMCGYTSVPPQSFETPAHLVQLWQCKRQLTEMKFVQILQKTDGRESTTSCSEGSVLLDSREWKKAILDITMMGKLSARAWGLGDMQ